MADDANPRAVIGGNNPPVDPFEGHRIHIEGLMAEARPYLTGAEITTEEQAAHIKRLKDDFNAAHDAADKSRITENEPFDKGKAAVQAKYAPLISDTKAMKGKTVVALKSLNDVLSPYLRKKELAQQEEARKTREAADEAALIATRAARAAVGDLEASEDAEELVIAAAMADADAKRAEKAKAQVKGDGRAEGLRSYWSAVMTDRKAALLHYIQEWPPEIIAALQALADADVRSGKRQLPGFDVIEDRRLP